MALLVYISQNWASKKITYQDILDATIMESILDPKLGWVLDIILSNGTISVGDKITAISQDGVKISTVRNILTPHDRNRVLKGSSKFTLSRV